MADQHVYELTQERHDRILAASQPVPYLVADGSEPSSPRESAHRAWEALGREMGFRWRTVKPCPEKGAMFFTAQPATAAYLALITPCPVCFSEAECPHTPVRCQHQWWYGKNPASLHMTPPTYQKAGGQRECEWCGRIERAELSWETVKA